MTHFNFFKHFGWKDDFVDGDVSLSHAHRSVAVPEGISFWRKFFIFAGPGFLVAVGYMDPGNWATDLAGGAKCGYCLLFVILFANLIAVLLQYLTIKLGVATGRDLAQMCRDKFSKPLVIFLWIMAEIMIVACDLAEVIGAAVAMNLLFGLPLIIGVLLTGLDVLLLLYLQNKGFRYLEAIIIALIAFILTSFGVEWFLSSPQIVPILHGFIPSAHILLDKEMLFLAIGILGATVMPHNLYLHSAVVQTRAYQETPAGKKEAIKFGALDSTIALTFAFVINSAILIVSAATFYYSGHKEVAEIGQAYKLFAPLLGTTLASVMFGLALLASGVNSTVTGTLAGQVIAEGFIRLRLSPWLRRVITRGLAIIPALFIVGLFGDNWMNHLLIISQVILSLQLPFAVFPLIYFTSDKKLMGEFANTNIIKYLAYLLATVILIANIFMIYLFI